MKKEQRLVKTIKNLVLSWMGYFAVILSTFIGRKIFVMSIGSDYLGVSGLFTNILSCLNLADLGLSVAITYSLYQPIAEKDYEKIKSIMKVFHKMYMYIGCIVGIIGITLTPFLYCFINDSPSSITYEKIQLYYLLFVINNALTYFLYYKSVLINADQRQYIVELNYSFSIIGMTIVQIFVLILFKNYTLYLLVQIAFTIIKNLVISYIADKNYPFLKEKNVRKLSNSEKKEITKGVSGMMFQKIGTVIVNSTDNVLISKFINLSLVGLYTNYYSIINALNMLLNQVFRSALASVGNLNVTASKNELYNVFKKSLFINFWIHGFTSICLTCLFNPFVKLWLGDKYLLEFSVVLILGINFFFNGMRQTCLMYNDALGLYWENRYKPIAEALINLLFSLILLHFYGLIGIFLGTLCSILFVCVWYEPYIIFKTALNIPIKEYLKKYFEYVIVTFITGLITFFFCYSVKMTGIFSFIILCIICMFVPNTLFLIYYNKSDEFRYFFDLVKNKILK